MCYVRHDYFSKLTIKLSSARQKINERAEERSEDSQSLTCEVQRTEPELFRPRARTPLAPEDRSVLVGAIVRKRTRARRQDHYELANEIPLYLDWKVVRSLWLLARGLTDIVQRVCKGTFLETHAVFPLSTTLQGFSFGGQPTGVFTDVLEPSRIQSACTARTDAVRFPGIECSAGRADFKKGLERS